MAGREKKNVMNKQLTEKMEIDKAMQGSEIKKEVNTRPTISDSKKENLKHVGVVSKGIALKRPVGRPRKSTADVDGGLKDTLRTRSASLPPSSTKSSPSPKVRRKFKPYRFSNLDSRNGIRNRTGPYLTRSDSPVRVLRNGKRRKLKDPLFDGFNKPIEYIKRKRLLSAVKDKGNEIVSVSEKIDNSGTGTESDNRYCETSQIENGQINCDSGADCKKRVVCLAELKSKENNSTQELQSSNCSEGDQSEVSGDSNLGKSISNKIAALIKRGKVTEILQKFSAAREGRASRVSSVETKDSNQESESSKISSDSEQNVTDTNSNLCNMDSVCAKKISEDALAPCQNILKNCLLIETKPSKLEEIDAKENAPQLNLSIPHQEVKSKPNNSLELHSSSIGLPSNIVTENTDGDETEIKCSNLHEVQSNQIVNEKLPDRQLDSGGLKYEFESICDDEQTSDLETQEDMPSCLKKDIIKTDTTFEDELDLLVKCIDENEKIYMNNMNSGVSNDTLGSLNKTDYVSTTSCGGLVEPQEGRELQKKECNDDVGVCKDHCVNKSVNIKLGDCKIEKNFSIEKDTQEKSNNSSKVRRSMRSSIPKTRAALVQCLTPRGRSPKSKGGVKQEVGSSALAEDESTLNGDEAYMQDQLDEDMEVNDFTERKKKLDRLSSVNEFSISSNKDVILGNIKETGVSNVEDDNLDVKQENVLKVEELPLSVDLQLNNFPNIKAEEDKLSSGKESVLPLKPILNLEGESYVFNIKSKLSEKKETISNACTLVVPEEEEYSDILDNINKLIDRAEGIQMGCTKVASEENDNFELLTNTNKLSDNITILNTCQTAIQEGDGHLQVFNSKNKLTEEKERVHESCRSVVTEKEIHSDIFNNKNKIIVGKDDIVQSCEPLPEVKGHTEKFYSKNCKENSSLFEPVVSEHSMEEHTEVLERKIDKRSLDSSGTVASEHKVVVVVEQTQTFDSKSNIEKLTEPCPEPKEPSDIVNVQLNCIVAAEIETQMHTEENVSNIICTMSQNLLTVENSEASKDINTVKLDTYKNNMVTNETDVVLDEQLSYNKLLADAEVTKENMLGVKGKSSQLGAFQKDVGIKERGIALDEQVSCISVSIDDVVLGEDYNFVKEDGLLVGESKLCSKALKTETIQMGHNVLDKQEDKIVNEDQENDFLPKTISLLDFEESNNDFKSMDGIDESSHNGDFSNDSNMLIRFKTTSDSESTIEPENRSTTNDKLSDDSNTLDDCEVLVPKVNSLVEETDSKEHGEPVGESSDIEVTKELTHLLAPTCASVNESSNVGECSKQAEGEGGPDEEVSPEDQAIKESILNALGLQSRSSQSKTKLTDSSYTGTLKTVIKVQRSPEKRGKTSLKLVFKHNKAGRSVGGEPSPSLGNGDVATDDELHVKERVEYRICKETGSAPETAGDPTNFGVGNRKCLKPSFTYRSYFDLSTNSPFLTENATAEEENLTLDPGTKEDGKGSSGKQSANLVIPEKSSSFSIHPGRLCSDVCSYCFGKFGSLDTPCHIAQLKNSERQQKILQTETHLNADSCLCDACYRHVDRKANCPSYKPNRKRHHRSSSSASLCCVQGCSQPVHHHVRRKWLLKLKRSIAKKVPIDMDKMAQHLPFPLCSQHYYWVDYFMVCGICKRRLTRNHMYPLGSEVHELNAVLADDGIPVVLSDKLFLCKLCRYFGSLRLKCKDRSQLTGNHKMFFENYRKRILHYHDIEIMDTEEAAEPITIPPKAKKRKTKPSTIDERGEVMDKNRCDGIEVDGQGSSLLEVGDFGSPDSVVELNRTGASTPMIDYSSLAYPGTDNGIMSKPKGPKLRLKVASVSGGKLNNVETSGSSSMTSGDMLSRSCYPSQDELPLFANFDFRQGARGEAQSSKRKGDWEQCTASIQFNRDTKKLFQELQRPYGNHSSFMRHLVLLEKYWRTGELSLSQTATPKAATYFNSVQNRLRAYEGVPTPSSNSTFISPSAPPVIAITSIPPSQTTTSLPIIDLPLRRRVGASIIPSPTPSSSSSRPITLAPISTVTSGISRPITFVPVSSSSLLCSARTTSTSTTAMFTSLSTNSTTPMPRKILVDSKTIPALGLSKGKRLPNILQVTAGGKSFSIVPNMAQLRQFQALQQQQLQQRQKQSTSTSPSNFVPLISDVRSLATDTGTKLWDKSELDVIPSSSKLFQHQHQPKLSVTILPKSNVSPLIRPNTPVAIAPKPTTIVTPTGIILSRNPEISVSSVPLKKDDLSKS